MQINRTDNSDVKAMTQGATDKPAKAVANTEARDSASVDTTGYVARAIALPMDGAASAAAVDEAKALIASGEIDRLDLIREAARNIVVRGI
jgi:hypothetical protein